MKYQELNATTLEALRCISREIDKRKRTWKKELQTSGMMPSDVFAQAGPVDFAMHVSGMLAIADPTVRTVKTVDLAKLVRCCLCEMGATEYAALLRRLDDPRASTVKQDKRFEETTSLVTTVEKRPAAGSVTLVNAEVDLLQTTAEETVEYDLAMES